MSQVTGFLVRNNLSDTGSLPRSGSWTGSPDIIPAGPVGLNPADLVKNYGKAYNNALVQGQENFLYVRAKNLGTAPLTQQVYLFHVPQSLFLLPHSWYAKSNLCNYKVDNTDYQNITANPNQVVSTNAFTWKPQSTEHHCLVTVIAKDWSDIEAQFPPNVNSSMNAYAQWIYQNGNIGWHNVIINAATTAVIEKDITLPPSPADDFEATFTLMAKNVPVGAKTSFTSNNATSSGQTISQGWTSVPQKPGAPDPTINPNFQTGTNATLNKGYEGVVTYKVDFQGHPIPDDFSMSFVATKAINPDAVNSNGVQSFVSPHETFHNSFHQVFQADAQFTHPETAATVVGAEGYLSMLTEDVGGWPIPVVIGSDSVYHRPQS